jgi:hypothetical protein
LEVESEPKCFPELSRPKGGISTGWKGEHAAEAEEVEEEGPVAQSGPFDCSDLKRAIKLDGWLPAKNKKHLNYEHPKKPGKVSLDEKWTAIRANDLMFRSIARQAGLDPRDLLLLVNGIEPKNSDQSD